MDETEVGRLYEAHWQEIFRFLRRRMPGADPAEVEDVTALVFERVLRAAPAYRDIGAPITAWLYRIAANLRVDLARAATRQPVICELDPTRDDRGDRLEWEPDPSTLERLAWAFALVAPRQQVALHEFYAREVPTAETAELLGISENEVRKLRLRGLARLRKLLEVPEPASMCVPVRRPIRDG